MKKGTIRQYADIRVISTLLVVIGHSTSLNLVNSSGQNIVSYTNTVHVFTEYIRKMIYSFHMPLFVALSGAVFFLTFDEKKPLSGYIEKKANRLLVPFILTAVGVLVPVRYLIGYYQEEKLLGVLFRDIILAYDINYLWYLLMLFEVSSLFYLLFLKVPELKKRNVLLLFSLFCISFVSFAFPTLPFQLNRALEFAFWFYVGMILERDRNKISNLNNKKIIQFLFLSLWLGSFLIFEYLDSILLVTVGSWQFAVKLVKMCVRYIMEYSAVLCIFLFFSGYLLPDSLVIHSVEKYSMAIYLLHCPIIYCYKKALSLIMPGIEMPGFRYITLMIVQICIGITLPILLSYMFEIGVKQIKSFIK